jgi:DNA polymerase-1
MNPVTEKVLLVDGNNLLVRAIKATSHSRMSSGGLDTGPLHVFINSLARHVREERPDRMVVCWDAGPSSRRVALYPAYKGNRKQRDPEEQERQNSAFGMAKRFLDLAGVAHISQEGQEADDLIAAYWHKIGAMAKIVILSNDKDFLQLLSGDTEQVRLSSGGAATDRWNGVRVLEEKGCWPHQIPLMMALTGDSGDNIPGVHSIGPKTALKLLLAADWDLDRIVHPKVLEQRANADLSLLLVDLCRVPDAQVDWPPRFEPTTLGTDGAAELLAFLNSLEMQTTIEKFIVGKLWH